MSMPTRPEIAFKLTYPTFWLPARCSTPQLLLCYFTPKIIIPTIAWKNPIFATNRKASFNPDGFLIQFSEVERAFQIVFYFSFRQRDLMLSFIRSRAIQSTCYVSHD